MKLLLALISLTLGTAAVIETVDMMNRAAEALEAALPK